ncbi:MAG: hypothetical protein ACD_50C00342G0002 [uncultured bacterium]|nr:MAG: hypothetical protein ACD_50C00342G0002 [uncultured bacterium]OGH14018.1 MAG: hypothetical protein A2687_06145 [Candidatus Levybacteria bacterium RIFCSPHIGHO2_01_FULL_38_26]
MTATKNISISTNEKIAFVSNLSTMLEAGIPILDTLDSLLEDSKGNLKKVLETVREDVSSGKRISFAFGKFPKVFDNVTVNIIKASEESGTLDVVLKDLRENITKETEFNDKIKSALIYPAVILVVFLGVLIVILTFVIPKISQVFTRLKVELPLPTQILIFTSNLVLNYTLPTIIVTLGLALGSFFLYKKNKKFFLNVFFSLPVVANLAKEIDLTRFSHSLYLLLNAGIPIGSALELTQEVVSKKDVEKAIIHARESVSSGKKLSEGLKDKKKTIPSIMIKLIEAGEKSGSLEKSMQDISKYFEYQVGKTLAATTVLLEPVVLVLTGIVIGGMMLSIIAPIYGLVGQIGAR